jgi:dTDP-4-amino-4,6-dideoxygalactose transaminase
MDLGSRYLPSDLLAAVLYAQLMARERIQEERRRIWLRYWSSLQGWANDQGVGLPVVPAECEPSYSQFHLLMPSLESRTRLIRHLKNNDISSSFHYLPLHLSVMGRRLGGKEGDCPVAEQMSDRLLRLPFYQGLRPEDQSRIVEAIQNEN